MIERKKIAVLENKKPETGRNLQEFSEKLTRLEMVSLYHQFNTEKLKSDK
jgi:hypothetical protein